MEGTYISKVDSSNKFWSYKTTGTTVEVSWGRLGTQGEKQVKSFDNEAQMNNFISSKVKEKLKKGYVLSTKEEKKSEEDTARLLGTQYKIDKIKWVDKKDNKLTYLLNYDPTRYIYVEIINSWTKDVTRLLMNKKDTWKIDGIALTSEYVDYDQIQSMTEYADLVRGVRGVLKRMFAKVSAVTVKFAAVGIRILDLGQDEEEDYVPPPQMNDMLAAVGESSVSKQVIVTFAAMGHRILDLD